MRLTAFTDHGLRVLVRMAGAPDRAFTAAALADEAHLSRNHLARVISALAGAGLVRTRRRWRRTRRWRRVSRPTAIPAP